MTDSYLIPEQIAVLLAAIKPHRVGKDGKNFSHVEAYELRAHLNRVFGFARWSEEVLEQEVVFAEAEQKTGKNGKPYIAHTVCYRSLVRLTVCAPDGTVLAVYTEGATGDATNQPSRADAHDLALKTSASQAFKRCCMNLGDAFGLSLYRKGSLEPLVKVTLVNGQGGAAGNHDGTELQDAAPPTFAAPDPEPQPAPEPDVAPAVRHHPTKKDPDTLREEVLAAGSRGDCIRLLREIETSGLGGETVADANGEVIALRDLTARRMKELG